MGGPVGVGHPPERAEPADRPWSRPLVLVPVFALVSLIGGLFPSFSLRANLYVLAVGGAMVWLGLSGRAAKRPSPSRLGRGAAWWLVPALLLGLVELTEFLLGSTAAHPTLSVLMDPVLDGYLARSACYFAWLSAFWGLVRR
jgi:hypothetical protein